MFMEEKEIKLSGIEQVKLANLIQEINQTIDRQGFISENEVNSYINEFVNFKPVSNPQLEFMFGFVREQFMVNAIINEDGKPELIFEFERA